MNYWVGCISVFGNDEVLTSKMDKNRIDMYPELDYEALPVQLKMFHQNFHPKTIFDARGALIAMSPDMRSLFYQVKKLHRILLGLPCYFVAFMPSRALIQFSLLAENLPPKRHGTNVVNFNGNIPLVLKDADNALCWHWQE